MLSTGAACAHPTLERQEATIGAPYKAVVRVPHGCEGSPTVRVRVQIPEGVIGVKPMPKPGWTIETTRGAYAEAHPYYHGAVLKEGVREIVWNGRLADDNYDEFVFVGFMAKTLSGRLAAFTSRRSRSVSRASRRGRIFPRPASRRTT